LAVRVHKDRRVKPDRRAERARQGLLDLLDQKARQGLLDLPDQKARQGLLDLPDQKAMRVRRAQWDRLVAQAPQVSGS
jgi:hypothetical protein